MKILKIFCSVDQLWDTNELNSIQSKDHNIWTYRVIKISLSCYNDKKHILEHGYSRLLDFHKSAR